MNKIILVLTLLMLLAGCKMGGIRGSGTRKSEKKEVPAFKAIETGGAFDVEITCQKPQSVEIEADDNLLPLLETDVSDGVLHVGMKQNYHSRKLIALRIAVPDLNRITISGAGTARVTGVKNENFVINSTGMMRPCRASSASWESCRTTRRRIFCWPNCSTLTEKRPRLFCITSDTRA